MSVFSACRRLIVVCCAAWSLAWTGAAVAQPANYQDLWWGGQSQSGWGLSIAQQGTVLFSVLYIYDGGGQPIWVVMPGGTWNASYTTYSGPLYMPSGTPFDNYDASRFTANASVGTASIAFQDTANAVVTGTINGQAFTRNIARQVFGSGAPINNYTDLWWGGASQNGWGLSLTQQGNVIFGVWFTYDSAGKPRWYVMPGGSFTATDTFSGTLYRTSVPVSNAFVFYSVPPTVQSVGSLTLRFAGSDNATMQYGVGTASGSNAIVRQPFGDAPAGMTSFKRIQQKIFAPQCLSCHTAGHPYAVQSGLVLDEAAAYRNLVNAPTKTPHATLHGFKQVMPGKADLSLLYEKLLLWDSSRTQLYEAPMPLGRASLSVGQLDFIKRWIDSGASESGDAIDPQLLDDLTPPSYVPFTPPPAPAKGYQLTTGAFMVAPNFERELFVLRPLGNPAPVYVNRIETKMRNNSHHLVLYTFGGIPSFLIPPADTIRDIRNPDGTLNTLNMFPMAYHVFFGGAMSQVSDLSLPPGVALELPAYAALDLNSHYVNKGADDIMGEAYANLHTVDRSEVQNIARTLNLSNTSFTLPPGQRTTTRKTFTFSSTTRIILLTSHMHKLGERFVIKIVGGSRNGEVIYDSDNWEHPLVKSFATPIVLSAGQGLMSEITYNNTTDRTIGFGLTSEDEMGIIFGYYY